MSTLQELMDWMQTIAPLHLSESWDNTGLLVGDPDVAVKHVQTCLTLDQRTVAEAVREQADLVIAHHPLPFKAVKTITTGDIPGRLLWQLTSNRVAVYAPHTAWDSAEFGINARLSSKLGLLDPLPLIPQVQAVSEANQPVLGAGRMGRLASPLSSEALARRLQENIPYCRMRGVPSSRPLQKLAFACGSAGSMLTDAVRAGCDAFITGEATYHTCLEAEAHGVALFLLGHYASERFAMEELAGELAQKFASVKVWASQDERDPVQSLLAP